MRITEVEAPNVLTKVFYKIGERMFGAVPTPQKVLAHRVPVMLGLGGLYGALEWFGKIDAPLRALLDQHVANLHGAPY